jgi:hypothetical protein
MEAWTDSYYSITFNSRGQLLFGDPDGQSLIEPISILSNLEVSAYKISLASCVLSVESDFSIRIDGVVGAKASLSSTASVSASALSIKNAKINAVINSNLEASVAKLIYASSSLSSSAALNASTTAIRYAESSCLANSLLNAKAYKISFAKSFMSGVAQINVDYNSIVFGKTNISSSLNAFTTAYKIAFAKSLISSEAQLFSSLIKIAKTQTSLSSNTTLSVFAEKIAFAKSIINATSSSLAEGTIIKLALISITGLVVKVTFVKVFLNIKSAINISSKVRSIPAIKFSDLLVEDTTNIRPLFVLNNKPITEHNRRLNLTVNQSFVQNKNWSSKNTRYYKKSGNRAVFIISWSDLPNSRDMTVDEKYGRDYIKKIASDPSVHTLKFANLDSNGVIPYTDKEYNVVVKNYTESLKRRDLVGDTYYWDCTIELEEV